jgi:LysM repeat protein
MTLGQFIFLLVINALVALVISVVVTLTLGNRNASGPVPVPQPTATVALPTVAPTSAVVEPTSGRTNTYVVQSGDNLSGIAFKYGVSVDALMKANGLANPDMITVGQTLVIPAASATTAETPEETPQAGTPEATVAARTPATARPSATAPSAPEVTIEQVRKAAPGGTDDVVVLANSGSWVKLLGWQLVDAEGNAYTFPDLRLFPGGTVQVHTASGKNTEVDLYWGIDRAAWSRGGVVILKDASGQVVQTYQMP